MKSNSHERIAQIVLRQVRGFIRIGSALYARVAGAGKRCQQTRCWRTAIEPVMAALSW